MADLTYEILTNREKYPDDRKIVLGDGEEVTVKQFRDALMPKSDFTKQTETWAKKERELQQTVEGLNGRLAAEIQAREAAAAASGKPPEKPAGGYTEEDLLADPVLGPIVKRLNDATSSLKAHEDRIKMHEDTWMRNQYTAQLADIGKRHNARFNADGKGQAFDQKAFLDYALSNQISNLEVAYQAFSRGDEVAASVKEAEARGVERGKQAAKVPVVPFGRRSGPTRPEGLPEGKTLDTLTDEEVAADPDMQRAMAGEAPEFER